MHDSDLAPTIPSRVPSDFAYRVPWHPSTTGNLHEELAKECCERHVLFGVTARLVAHRQDCDDFLFELFGSRVPGEFAVVHLVFGGRRETDPRWPGTRVFATFQDWVVQCMQPEADEWADAF